jgi:hypothetical protein
MLTLPDNPTPEQLQAIALATIRQTFEDTAESLRDLAPLDGGGWQAVYSADGVDFNITYSESEGFEKWPVGGGQDG